MKYVLFLLSLFLAQHIFAQRKLVLVEGGEFTPLYGTDKKPTKVKNFEMDDFPVTNQEYLVFVKKNSEWRKSMAVKVFIDKAYLQHWKSELELGPKAIESGPVVNISWYAAKAFCENEGKRLPTVNEWEFVASRPIANVDIRKLILDWYSVPTPDVLPEVYRGKKNSLGISSMHGLIWEWTLDFNSTMVTGESRGDGSLDKSLYCGAGSSGAADKSDYAAFMRFAFRSSLKANYSVSNLGFRCVKEGVLK